LLGGQAWFFETGLTWSQVLDTEPKGGNAYFILAHQYIAAYLNSIKDLDPAFHADLAEKLALAEALLDAYDQVSDDPLKWGPPFIPEGPDRVLALELAGWLDAFNNGMYGDELGDGSGPNHCESWMPNITEAMLQVSKDKTTWGPVAGNIKDGFSVELDGTEDFFYLDISSMNPIPAGMYPFFLVGYDNSGYKDWWNLRGVNDSACPADTWQCVMWHIINGKLPIFYLKVTDMGGGSFDYMLVDGLQYFVSGGTLTDYLRVNGSYPPGTYTFQGIEKVVMTFATP
jgi:hypothetical protein